MRNSSVQPRRLASMAAVASLFAGVVFAVVTVSATPAAAVPPGPPPISEPTASMVTADALPTPQIDGVVWTQKIIGNMVYAGGDFANARPAGAAAGTNLTPRSDVLAYDVTTGLLNTSFAPVLNGQVKTVAGSPDGSRVYVGGEFTTVNGLNRYRIAAFSTATGALLTTFAPAVDYRVEAIVATNSTVYVGGAFGASGSSTRTRLAAFSATNGALLAWNPSADYNVTTMVMTPSGSKLIVGGAFQHINGSSALGLGAIDPITGALLPWAAGNTVQNYGSASAIDNLSTDGTSIFGSGYVFRGNGGAGNLEGSFSADPESGNINWIEDCHGDTYGVVGMNGVVYTVSHSHYCGNVGSFPQTDPWTMHRGLAWSYGAQGTIGHDPYGYFDWFGKPAPSQYNWYPDMNPGTFTGQGQAAWAVTGNGQYLVMGGEFTSVNFNGGQQGLVRFALKPPSPGAQAPRLSGANFVPSVNATSSHTARVTWQANWDRDNQNLTYKVIRNNVGSAPVYTTTATSQFWNRPSLGYVDAGLTPGATYTYKIYAVDPSGNTSQGSNVSITMPLTDPSPYVQQVLNDGPSNYWRLGEPSGTTGVDAVGANNLVEGTSVGHGATGAVATDTDKASTFNGSTTSTAGTTNAVTGPNTFSVEAFFKTTTLLGGKIVGFGTARSGTSTSYDRHLYMDNSGRIFFGAFPGSVRTVNSTGTYRNGAWHHVVGTLSSGGMALYVDGVRVGFDASTTSAQVYSGYWRVGGDALASWPSKPSSNNFSGSIDDVAVYQVALTPAQVLAHYRASTGVGNQAPTASFTSSCPNLTCAFDGSTSGDPDGTVTGYAWAFGDGTSGAGATPSHTYPTSGTYTATLTVTDNQGGSNAISHTVNVSAPNQAPVASFVATCAGLTCSYDASGSHDPDGSIQTYSWDFGDSTTGTGASATHTYSGDNNYTVVLTVTDNQNASNSSSKVLTVAAAALVASDTFNRSVSNGWGTADVGGPWTVSGVAASNFSVGAGSGRMQAPIAGNWPSAYLSSVIAADTDSSVDVTLDKLQTGSSNAYIYLAARRTGTSQYRLRLKQAGAGGIQLSLVKSLSGTDAVLTTSTIPGLNMTPGSFLRMRFRVGGTSSVTLSGKVWSVGDTEPAGWQVTSTDATNAVGAGSSGLSLLLSSASTNAPVLATFQNLTVGPITGP